MAKRFCILTILFLCSLVTFLSGCGGDQAYTASGRVTLAGAPDTGVEGVTLFFPPATQKAETDVDGNWSAALEGTVKVVPAGLAWIFTPPSKEVASCDPVANFSATHNLATVMTIAAGGWHTMALLSGGGLVFSWGNATYGQPGVGGVATRIDLPVQTADLINVQRVSAGGLHSVALIGGTLWSWGYGLNGELGNGANLHQSSPVVVSSTLTGFTAVAAGWSHTLALKSDGSVWAWGRNDYGQLGNNSTASANAPVQVSGLAGITITAIAAGGYHSLARAVDGTVYAWGQNTSGQLGLGDDAEAGEMQTEPKAVEGLTGVASIAAGTYHSVAVGTGGSVYVWGRNTDGQLGDGLTANRNTPYQLTGLGGVTQIAAGGSHTMALAGGTIYAWGNNRYGQVGDGTTDNCPTPTALSGTFTAIAAGNQHSAALGSDDAIYTWGRNNFGQLGNGMAANVLAPAAL